ncbi:MAG TPA: hypothetical protein ENH99_00165 [Candidatus Pacearchaeota archaeon]|nr:hypothetical protein [Candidatus Pacearchaeota archaeon]
MEKRVRGDRLDDIGEYERIKLILISFLRGYPSWRYYGIFEYYFKERSKSIIDRLKEDGFVNVLEEKNMTYYWLTPRGVELASSLSARKSFLSTKQRVKRFKDVGLALVGMTVVIGLAHYFLTYAQYPLF